MADLLKLAKGLSRSRMAEILYEHEGFVDHEHGRHASDRATPEWIDREISADLHSGDCTKNPWPCMRCHADLALAQWDEFVFLVERALAASRHNIDATA